jgi:hypothetical protein
MSKNTNLSFLTDYITADITNGRIGINNASPAYAFDVNGTMRTSGATYLATASGNVGIGTTSAEGVLTIKGTSAQPPTSGTTANSLLQLVGSLGAELNIGSNTITGGYGSYIQASDNNLAVPYPLNLQPNGGNVGIGTSSPVGKLNIWPADNSVAVLRGNSGVSASVPAFEFFSHNSSATQGGLAINTFDGTSFERLRITYNGFVGIGTSSPSGILDVIGTNILLGATSKIVLSYDYGTSANNNSPELAFYGQSFAATTSIYGPSIQAVNQTTFARKDLVFYQHNAADFANRYEAMRLTYGGDLLVGKTSSNWQLAGVQTEVNGITLGITNASPTANNLFLRKNGVVGIVASFYYDNTEVGKISITSTSTSYLTNSDYRLKEDLKQINGIEILSKIKVYDFKWKVDNSRMDGVLAHELAEVLPYAVNGVKDGEQMQGVDYSKIVPVLIRSVQELSAELTSAKQEIEILKQK